jgi:short-subunit dehydrogenase
MNEQAKRVAIVTGGSRGIGAAVAERLPQDGFAAVVVNYSGQAAPASSVVGLLQPTYAVYAATKAGAEEMIKATRLG